MSMVENIDKLARKHSEDPVQEALREHKSQWNQDTSLLIAQLIAFKRGLNGRGEPRVGLPPGSIKDPVSPEVGRYLEQLAENYQRVVSDAKSIIDEQAQYAENRQKNKKEVSGVTASFEDEMVKYASWWGSRAWTHAKAYGNPKYWFFRDEDIKDRLRLLRLSEKLKENLEEIDNDLVSSGKDAIPTAIYDFIKFSEIFEKLLMPKLNNMVSRHAKMIEEEKKNPLEKIIVKETPSDLGQKDELVEDSIKKPSEEDVDNPIAEFSGQQEDYTDEIIPKKQNLNKTDVNINRVIEINDDLLDATEVLGFMKMLNIDDEKIPLFKIQFRKLKSLAESVKNKYKKVKQSNDEAELYSLQKIYIELLNLYSDFSKDVAEFLGLDKNLDWTFSVLSAKAKERLKNKLSHLSPEFQKMATNSLNRWLKKQKMKLFPNTTQQLQIECSDKIKEIIRSIDKFQDLLEDKKKSIIDLSNEIKITMILSADLADSLYGLAKIYNVQYEEDRFSGKTEGRLITERNISYLKKITEYLKNTSKSL